MKKTFIKESFLTIFAMVFCLAASFGQTTITTGAVTPNPVCAGGNVSVAFTFTGTPAANTDFIAQLSDATGTFGLNPTEIGSSTTSPIAATVPAGTTAGAAYKIRVISRILAVIQITGSESAALTVNAVPAAPTVTNKTYTVGDASGVLTATGVSGATFKWYDTEASTTPLASAPTPSTAAVVTKSYFVTQTVSSCESAKAELVVTVQCAAPAAPTVANKTYTVGDAAAPLTATGAAGATFQWYETQASTTPLASAPTPSTTSAGTKSYFVTQTVGGCESPKAELVVTVANCATPAPTVANKSYFVGDAATALTATGVTGAVFKWYDSQNSTSPLASAPTPSTTTPGTKSYFVTQTAGGCEGPKAELVVTVNCVPPAAPTVTNRSYTVGDPATVLTAGGVAGAIFKWYNSQASTTPLPSAPTPNTSTAGTTSYFVTQTVGGCESPKAKIDVVVSNCVISDAPTVTSPTSYCASTTPVAALVATGTSIKWYNAAGTALGSAPTPNVNVNTTTEYKYYVTQTQSGKCESAKKEVVVTVNKTVLPGVSDIDYCQNSAATPLTATGTSLKWYATSSSNTALATAPTPATTTVGKVKYYVTQTLNGCESERASIEVTVKAIPAAPTVKAIAAVCQGATVGSSVLLNAVTATGTLQWYVAATGGSGTSTVPTPNTETAGVKKFYVSQTVNGCESARAEVSIEVKSTPAPTVTTPVPYCQNEKATAVTATGTALKWYNALTGGTQYSAAPTPSTTNATTITYYVSQTLSSCESPRTKLDVVINATPGTVSTLAKEFCQERTDKSYAFPTEASQGNTLKWYTVATGGTATTSTPSVNLKDAKETIYYVTQVTDKNCESKDRSVQKVRVKPLPAIPGVSQALIEYCQFIAAKPLEATAASGASLNWFGTDATGGTSSPNAPVPSTAEGGTTSYYVAQTLEGCIGDRAKIDVKINTTPKPVTKTYLEYCQNATAPVLDATGTILKWYREANGTEYQGVPFVPFTEKVEDYSFYVTQTGTNGCESPKEEIKIHIKSKPSATISGNSTIDLGQTANINIKFTGEGPWIYILSSGLTDTTDQANLQVQVKPSTTTSYLLTEVSNACGKGTINGVAVVTVKVPTINTGNASVAEICAGKAFTVPFQQSGDFPPGNTFKLQVSKENADAKFYTIASTATASTVSATFPDTTKGGTYFVRVISSGANPDFTVKGSVSAITINASPLPVATLSGTQTILVGESADLKAEITGKAPWTLTLNNGAKDTLITANSTPFNFKLAPKTTTTYAITKVSNGCGIGTGVGTARVQVDPILGVEPPAPVDWAKVYPTVINGKCTVEVTGTISPKQAKIEVVDLNGRPRSTTAIKQQKTEVDFANYPSGLYLLRIQNGNLSTVQRVMKP